MPVAGGAIGIGSELREDELAGATVEDEVRPGRLRIGASLGLQSVQVVVGAPLKSHVAVNREDMYIYKAHHKGTIAGKKKKKAKLQRAIRSMKKQQCLTSENSTPLIHLRDPQEFAENLFSRLQVGLEVDKFDASKAAIGAAGVRQKGSDGKSTPFKIPSADELIKRPLDPAKLETGGLSNKQKEHKKAMPLVAKRAKVAKSRVEKRKKQQLSGKNFRGKKAWK